MHYTKEVLYHFLITGAIAGVVLSIILSQTQTDLTTVNFDVSVQVTISDDLLVLLYSVYNTGDTVIDSVSTVVRCCSYSMTSTSTLNPNESKSTTEYLSINATKYSKGDSILVEFSVSDDMGNSKTMTKSIKLG